MIGSTKEYSTKVPLAEIERGGYNLSRTEAIMSTRKELLEQMLRKLEELLKTANFAEREEIKKAIQTTKELIADEDAKTEEE